jgi:hypothetical protein
MKAVVIGATGARAGCEVTGCGSKKGAKALRSGSQSKFCSVGDGAEVASVEFSGNGNAGCDATEKLGRAAGGSTATSCPRTVKVLKDTIEKRRRFRDTFDTQYSCAI